MQTGYYKANAASFTQPHNCPRSALHFESIGRQTPSVLACINVRYDVGRRTPDAAEAYFIPGGRGGTLCRRRRPFSLPLSACLSRDYHRHRVVGQRARAVSAAANAAGAADGAAGLGRPPRLLPLAPKHGRYRRRRWGGEEGDAVQESVRGELAHSPSTRSVAK